MDEKKDLRIVVVCATAIDVQEMIRIRDAVKTVTGEELRPMCDAGKTLVFATNADFNALFKAIAEAKASSTQFFIGTLEEPYSTIGLQPTVAKIEQHLRQKRLKGQPPRRP